MPSSLWGFLSICAAAGEAERPPDLLLYDGAQPHQPLLAADVDGDGADELAWLADQLYVMPELGTVVGATGTAEGGFGKPLAAPDYDGDGSANLLVVHYTEAADEWWDNTLGRSVSVDGGGQWAVADVDGDRHDDLISGVGVLQGAASGFTAGATLDGVTADSLFAAHAVGDLDGDGATDVVASAGPTDSPGSWTGVTTALRLYLSSDRTAERWPARWSWEKPPASPGTAGPGSYGFRGYVTGASVAAADVDGDGTTELVVLSFVTDPGPHVVDVTLLADLTAADGPRVLASQEHTSSTAWALHTLGDLDGDGDDEVLFDHRTAEIVDVEPIDGQVLAPAPGAPLLAPPVPATGSDWEHEVTSLTTAVGDFDGDGTADIATAYSWIGGEGRVAIWFGTSLVTSAAYRPAEPSAPQTRSASGCGCSSSGGMGGAAMLLMVVPFLRRPRAVATLLLGACASDKGADPVEEPTFPHTVSCGVATCDPSITADCGAMAEALGWTVGTGWPAPATPDEVRLGCGDDPGLWTEITFALDDPIENPGVALGGPTCNCVPQGTALDPNCCAYADPCASGAFVELLTEQNCAFDCTPNCDEPAEWIVRDQDDCEAEEAFMIAPAATKVLHVDPLHSYLLVQTPTDQDTFSVRGGGSARTSTDQFMTVTLYAEDGELDGYDMIDWWFWTSAPIDYEPSAGTFTVDDVGSPPFLGAGYRDAQGYALEVSMGEQAVGAIDTVGATWELDYTESAYGWALEVHLEGDIEDVP